MRKQEEHTVKGGVRVTCTQMAATDGYRMVPKIGKLVAGAGSALGAFNFADLAESDISVLAPAFYRLFCEMDAEDADVLMLGLLKNCTALKDGAMVNLGSKPQIDHVFDGNLRGLMECLWFSIKVNFGDFFEGGLPILADQQSAVEKTQNQ